MTSPAPEFSRPFRLDRLGQAAVTEQLAARPDERAALAKRFGLLALDRLEAEVTLAWRAGGTLLELSGRFRAAATQRCVVSLEPLPVVLDEPFNLSYAAPSTSPSQGTVKEATDDEDETLDLDAPEPLPPGELDLGEEVAQVFALALDPYPRKPDSSLPDTATDASSLPFAALTALKKKD